jgi:nucleoside-diphosphate-sugar epimerase
MTRVALLGASGAIGKTVAEALRVQARPYRVVGRNREKLVKEFGGDPLAEIVTWNPDDPASVRAAVRDIDTIVYLLGVPYTQFELHPQLMRKTLDGAIAEGVQNLLLIGTVYPYGMPLTYPVLEDHPRAPHTFKGKMRKEQEDLLLEADKAGKIHGAVLRLPDFYGPGVETSYVTSLFKAAATGGRAQLIGPVDKPHEFIFVPDVGPVVARLIEEPRAWGQVWHLGGAGTITTREMARQAFALSGRKPKWISANYLMLRLMGLFNPLMREVAEMYYLWTHPILLDDTALQELLPGIKKTPYAEGIRQTLAHELPARTTRAA